MEAHSGPALAELGQVPWRKVSDARFLRRQARIWHIWTLAYTIPFVAMAGFLMYLEPLAFPVAFVSLAHAWVIPEMHAFRGASSVRPKGPRNEGAEPVAQGLLGDLLSHEARDLQRATGLVVERGGLGAWIVGEGGALLIPPGGRRAHGFCVGTADKKLPPSDRIAHLLLALRSDELGFATVANHQFCGAHWRVRRRMPKQMRPAMDAARARV